MFVTSIEFTSWVRALRIRQYRARRAILRERRRAARPEQRQQKTTKLLYHRLKSTTFMLYFGREFEADEKVAGAAGGDL